MNEFPSFGIAAEASEKVTTELGGRTEMCALPDGSIREGSVEYAMVVCAFVPENGIPFCLEADWLKNGLTGVAVVEPMGALEIR